MKHRLLVSALLCSATLSVAMADTPSIAPAVPFISGGVGDDSMANLVAREKEFDLKLFLVGQSGGYLSDIRITITNAQG